ncbi:MAG: sigma-54 dependent transcriptional regulator [Ectothiorhodospiraceae bacterium]|nr:sigma-54 dependent transcriptional regulator [Ectothiorhodospiraceae bacterium]
MSQASILPTVLLIEDDRAQRETLCQTLLGAGHRVAMTNDGREALRILTSQPIGLVLCDLDAPALGGLDFLRTLKSNAPDIPVISTTVSASLQTAVEAVRLGAADVLGKPIDAALLRGLVQRLLREARDVNGGLVVEDPASRELLELARRVAGSDATVMLNGESGVGKEVFARFIHRESVRASGPFVAINCAAIPKDMLEAMLFGFEKGAFTGAVESRPGKFEQAQGGTLLLDEISEMDLALQAKLLRVLQEREVERLGGRRMIPLDLRVLATTNRELHREVESGRFREDLFYRLNVFPLTIPPLRERVGDILPLARRMIAQHGRGIDHPQLTSAAEARLLDHPWPGNVRELDNVIQRAMILRSGAVIDADAIRFELVASAAVSTMAAQGASRAAANLGRSLRSREETLIIEALKAGNGSRKHAAERLGISPRTLRYKLARLRESGVAIPV